MKAIEKAGYKPGKDVALALDPASTEFFKDGAYVYEGEGKKRSSEEQAEYLAELVGRYPIVSIEDGMAEDDFEGWKLADRGDRRQMPAGRRRSVRDQCRSGSPTASQRHWPIRS